MNRKVDGRKEVGEKLTRSKCSIVALTSVSRFSSAEGSLASFAFAALALLVGTVLVNHDSRVDMPSACSTKNLPNASFTPIALLIFNNTVTRPLGGMVERSSHSDMAAGSEVGRRKAPKVCESCTAQNSGVRATDLKTSSMRTSAVGQATLIWGAGALTVGFEEVDATDEVEIDETPCAVEVDWVGRVGEGLLRP